MRLRKSKWATHTFIAEVQVPIYAVSQAWPALRSAFIEVFPAAISSWMSLVGCVSERPSHCNAANAEENRDGWMHSQCMACNHRWFSDEFTHDDTAVDLVVTVELLPGGSPQSATPASSHFHAHLYFSTGSDNIHSIMHSDPSIRDMIARCDATWNMNQYSYLLISQKPRNISSHPFPALEIPTITTPEGLRGMT